MNKLKTKSLGLVAIVSLVLAMSLFFQAYPINNKISLNVQMVSANGYENCSIWWVAIDNEAALTWAYFTASSQTVNKSSEYYAKKARIMVRINKAYAPTEQEALDNTRISSIVLSKSGGGSYEYDYNDLIGKYVDDETAYVYFVVHAINLTTVELPNGPLITEGYWTITTTYQIYVQV